MSLTVDINPSIAANLNIDPIGHAEIVILSWEAEEDLPAEDMEFTLYNSTQKNTSRVVENVVTIQGKIMAWKIAPIEQLIVPNKYYFEVFNKTTQRLEYKGLINITR